MKLLKALLLSSVVAFASNAAMATTLTFDDVGGGLSGSNYGGFTWNNINTYNATNAVSGYHNGIVSGSYVAYNANANPGSFSSATAFTLNSAFFTGAWNDGLTIHAVGTGLNNYSMDFVVNTNAPSEITFNWTGLTSVQFSSSGGTPHGFLNGSGAHFALDNLTVNAVSAVPEAETYAMLLAGLGVMGAVARRRKAKQA